MFPKWSLSPIPKIKNQRKSLHTSEKDDNFTDFKHILKEDNFDIMEKRIQRKQRMRRR